MRGGVAAQPSDPVAAARQWDRDVVGRTSADLTLGNGTVAHHVVLQDIAATVDGDDDRIEYAGRSSLPWRIGTNSRGKTVERFDAQLKLCRIGAGRDLESGKIKITFTCSVVRSEAIETFAGSVGVTVDDVSHDGGACESGD